MRGTTLLQQCGWGAWAGRDVSSGPRQYFGDDYLSSLALALRAVSPPLVLTNHLRLGLEGVWLFSIACG